MGGGGFRKGLMEKMTLEVLFGGWRTFSQMEKKTWVPGCFTERERLAKINAEWYNCRYIPYFRIQGVLCELLEMKCN